MFEKIDATMAVLELFARYIVNIIGIIVLAPICGIMYGMMGALYGVVWVISLPARLFGIDLFEYAQNQVNNL